MNERRKWTKTVERRRRNKWRVKMGETLQSCGQTNRRADEAGGLGVGHVHAS